MLKDMKLGLAIFMSIIDTPMIIKRLKYQIKSISQTTEMWFALVKCQLYNNRKSLYWKEET